MNIGIVSDELSLDPKESFKIAQDMGINHFELRSVWNSRVPELKKNKIDELEKLIQEYGITVTALSPGIFKVPLSSPDIGYHKDELLKKTFKLGERINVDTIIIFGIKRSKKKEAKLNEVISHINDVVLRAKKRGFNILLENEPGWWADKPENLLSIFKEIDEPNFNLNWDPANLAALGVAPYPGGYQLLKDFVENVHVKDVKKKNNEYKFTTINKGLVNWEEQLKALKKDNYQGIITLETHCKPLIQNSKKNLSYLRELLS